MNNLTLYYTPKHYCYYLTVLATAIPNKPRATLCVFSHTNIETTRWQTYKTTQVPRKSKFGEGQVVNKSKNITLYFL